MLLIVVSTPFTLKVKPPRSFQYRPSHFFRLPKKNLTNPSQSSISASLHRTLPRLELRIQPQLHLLLRSHHCPSPPPIPHPSLLPPKGPPTTPNHHLPVPDRLSTRIAVFFLSSRPSILPISRSLHLISKYAYCTWAMVVTFSSSKECWLDRTKEEGKVLFQDHLIEESVDLGGREDN